MEAIKWILEGLLKDLVVKIILSCLFPVGVWLVLFIFGLEARVIRPKRKVFWIAGFFTAFLAVDLLVESARHFNSQMEDIRNATPRHGGFRAGLISAFKINNPMQPSTNQITVTMSGIGPQNANIDQNGANFGFILRIENSGQPSVAWNWKVSIYLPSGQQMDAAIPSLAVDSSGPIATIIGPYYLKMEDNLIQSLATSPLPTGAGKIGWMIIHMNGINEIPIGSRFILTFDDVFGRQTKIEHVWAPPFN